MHIVYVDHSCPGKSGYYVYTYKTVNYLLPRKMGEKNCWGGGGHSFYTNSSYSMKLKRVGVILLQKYICQTNCKHIYWSSLEKHLKWYYKLNIKHVMKRGGDFVVWHFILWNPRREYHFLHIKPPNLPPPQIINNI